MAARPKQTAYACTPSHGGTRPLSPPPAAPPSPPCPTSPLPDSCAGPRRAVQRQTKTGVPVAIRPHRPLVPLLPRPQPHQQRAARTQHTRQQRTGGKAKRGERRGGKRERGGGGVTAHTPNRPHARAGHREAGRRGKGGGRGGWGPEQTQASRAPKRGEGGVGGTPKTQRKQPVSHDAPARMAMVTSPAPLTHTSAASQL